MASFARFHKKHPIEYASDEDSPSPPALLKEELLSPAAAATAPSCAPPLLDSEMASINEGFESMHQFLDNSLSDSTKTEYQV